MFCPPLLDSFTFNALSGCIARHQLPDVHHCPVYCTPVLPIQMVSVFNQCKNIIMRQEDSHLRIFQRYKKRETNIYKLWHVWTETCPLWWNWVTAFSDDSSLAVTHQLPPKQQTHLDVITANASVNQVLRVFLHSDWKLIGQIGWRRVKDFVVFITCILKISARASHERSLTVKGVYSGAQRQSSLSLNDSSLGLIRRRQSSTQSCSPLTTGIIIFSKHHQFLPLPLPTGSDAWHCDGQLAS